MSKPDVASQENLLVPVLIEGDEITDISENKVDVAQEICIDKILPVSNIGLFCQHACDKHIVHTEYSSVTIFKDLRNPNIKEMYKDEKSFNQGGNLSTRGNECILTLPAAIYF